MSHVSTGGYIEVIHIEVLWRFFQRLPFISQRLSLSFEVFLPLMLSEVFHHKLRDEGRNAGFKEINIGKVTSSKREKTSLISLRDLQTNALPGKLLLWIREVTDT